MTTYKVWIQIEKIPDEGDPENVTEPHDFGKMFYSFEGAMRFASAIMTVAGVSPDDPIITWEFAAA